MSDSKKKISTAAGGKTTGAKRTAYNRNPRIIHDKFEGMIDDLKGHVFDYKETKSNSDQYDETLKWIVAYAMKEHGRIVGTAIKTLSPAAKSTLVKPDEKDAFEMDIYTLSLKEIARERLRVDKDMKKMFQVVVRQCTPAMEGKIKEFPDWNTMEAEMDVIKLLKDMRVICYEFQAQQHPALSTIFCQKRFLGVRQDPTMSNDTYYKEFQNRKEVMKHAGIQPPMTTAMRNQALESLGYDLNTTDSDELLEATTQAAKTYVALVFLSNSDNARYGGLKTDLRNNFNRGVDLCPIDLPSALKEMNLWATTNRQTPRHAGTAVAYVTEGDEDEDGLDEEGTAHNVTGDTPPEPICWICKKPGHKKWKCPEFKAKKKEAKDKAEEENEGVNILMDGIDAEEAMGFVTQGFSTEAECEECDLAHVMQHVGQSPIESWMVLLDSQATHNVICNPKMVTNIRWVNRGLKVHTLAGYRMVHRQADFPGINTTVWFDLGGFANVLSLALVRTEYRIQYDSMIAPAFIVHGANKVRFVENGGLHTYDVQKDGPLGLQECANEVGVAHVIATVAGRENEFTARDVKRAKVARELQGTIGNPSYEQYLKIVENNGLPGSPVTIDDVKTAQYIWGENLGNLKGKMTQRKVRHVAPVTVPLPAIIQERYTVVTLSIDVMKVLSVPFLMTISRNIRFLTASLLSNMKGPTLLENILSVVKVYTPRGFRIRHIMGDGQFECLRESLADKGMSLHICGRNEHQPDIERGIRTVKDKTRACRNMLPYKRIPLLMIMYMVYSSCTWLNAFVATNGISATLPPRGIVLGTQMRFDLHCQVPFGAYAQVLDVSDNTMNSRSVGAICLGTTGNTQGSYRWMNLSTGRKITHTGTHKVLPVPQEVIDRVDHLGARLPPLENMTFTWSDGADIPDIDPPAAPAGVDMLEELGEHEIQADAEDPDTVDYDVNMDDDVNGHANDDAAEGAPTAPDHFEGLEDEAPHEETERTAALVEHTHDETPLDETPPGDEQPNDNVPPVPTPTIPVLTTEDEGVDEPDTPPPPRRSQRVGRPPKRWIEEMDGYEGGSIHLFSASGDRIPVSLPDFNLKKITPKAPVFPDGSGMSIIMTQYGLKKGLSMYGDTGAQAVLSEMKQLEDYDCLMPRSGDLTRADKRAALQYLMFITKKRCGQIKARGCADGRKQRRTTEKHDAAAPTVAIESVFLTSVVDAREERDVATVDIPGAFLQTAQPKDDTVIVRLEGKLAEIMCLINPKIYRKHIIMEGGKEVIYAQLKKSLYGTMAASLNFWRELTAFLVEELEFEVNPYDASVANKMVDGKQCTIVWHVDDLKISHVDPDVVTKIIEALQKKYGTMKDLTVRRGKIHDYLGMTLDFSTKGMVKVLMKDYIEKILKEVPAEMDGVQVTPAANHLFEVNVDATKLDENQAKTFHYLTAKLLFLCKRARPDIQTAVAFLTTRVREPDIDDWKKLFRVVKYLRGTKDLELTLDGNGAMVIKWWIDGSFAVHPDMRSHTGATMSMGKGSVYSTSMKQKLNTRSSTEAEVVAVNDVLAQVVWTRYFMGAQGYEVGESTVYQDNQSAMLLEQNGRASMGKRSRHMNIRYFFIVDRVDKGEVKIRHCPTGDMIGDYYTKPLQGSAFRKFRNLIMNINE